MNIRLIILLLLSTFGLLTGCGGGGGGNGGGGTSTFTTLSGTAAAGAPIAGIVTVRDSSSPVKETTAPIDSFGKYSVDVSTMTAPFILRATGSIGNTSYNLHSGATQADVGGTINITPLTDLILSNVAGQIAANLYTSGNYSAITDANLNSAQSALQAKLLPVLADLGLSATIDLLRLSFDANHTGMDKLLDALQVNVSTASATITNIINNSQIVDNFAAADPVGTLSGTGTNAGLSEFDQILAQFKALTNAFATSLPSSSTLASLFDSGNFLFEGQSLNQFLTMITTAPTMVGVKFTNIKLESLNTSAYPYAAVVRVNVIQAGRPVENMGMKLGKASASAKWLLQGDGRVSEVFVGAQALFSNLTCSDGNPNPRTGLELSVRRASDPKVDYAIVKGAGLPAGGVLLFDRKDGNWFTIATGAYNGVSTTGLTCGHNNHYIMNDATIAQVVDNGTYTIELWDDANTTAMGDDVKLYTYTQKLAKAPVLNANLSAANFATITASNLAAIISTGGTFNVSWTRPANTYSSEVQVFRRYTTGPLDSLNFSVTPTATSASTSIPAAAGAILNYGINLAIQDVYGREFGRQQEN